MTNVKMSNISFREVIQKKGGGFKNITIDDTTSVVVFVSYDCL